ncbi:MAG TPA: hypothetical protein VGI17_16720 [Solirubrobacterales bacterium]
MLQDEVRAALPQQVGDRALPESGLGATQDHGKLADVSTGNRPHPSDHRIKVAESFFGPALEAAVRTGPGDRLAPKTGQLSDLLGRQGRAQLPQLVEGRFEVELGHVRKGSDIHDLPHNLYLAKSHTSCVFLAVTKSCLSTT